MVDCVLAKETQMKTILILAVALAALAPSSHADLPTSNKPINDRLARSLTRIEQPHGNRPTAPKASEESWHQMANNRFRITRNVATEHYFTPAGRVNYGYVSESAKVPDARRYRKD